MDELMKILILFCLIFWNGVFGAPLHKSDGAAGSYEAHHIVIIDRQHPSPLPVTDLLERVALHPHHHHVRHIYNNTAFRGFAATLSKTHLAQLAAMPEVSIVERATTVSHTSDKNQPRSSPALFNTRPNGPWGLERISTAMPVTGTASAMDFTYSFANVELGEGADIYIVDTGVYVDNAVFSGRAHMLWAYDGIMTDNNGHGTHVSGTAAGALVGVASRATLFGLKALDAQGTGSSSDVVAAIDRVIASHDSRQSISRGSVISMSLSTGGVVSAINTAVSAAIAHGIHVCVAAGNSNQDACGFTPSMQGGTHGAAIAVGAIDMTAERASFSNFGDCVDVYAPGEDVISAWIGGPQMVNSLSGTSMATPHVTGIVAYAMVNSTLARSPAAMKAWLKAAALTMSDGLLLANNGAVGD